MGMLPRRTKPVIHVSHRLHKSARIARAGKNAVLLAGDDFVAAFDPASLQPRWHHALPPQGVLTTPLVELENDVALIAFGVDEKEDLGWLYCVGLGAGETRWSRPFPFEFCQRRAIRSHYCDQGRLVVSASAESRRIVVDTQTGVTLHEIDCKGLLCGVSGRLGVFAYRNLLSKVDLVHGVVSEYVRPSLQTARLAGSRLWLLFGDEKGTRLVCESVTGERLGETVVPGNLSFARLTPQGQGVVLFCPNWGTALCPGPGKPLAWHVATATNDHPAVLDRGVVIADEAWTHHWIDVDGNIVDIPEFVDSICLVGPSIALNQDRVLMTTLDDGSAQAVVSFADIAGAIITLELPKPVDVSTVVSIKPPKKRQKKDRVQAALADYAAGGTFAAFAQALCEAFGIDAIHDDVTELLLKVRSRRTPLPGPVGILPLEKMLSHVLTYDEMFSLGSDQHLVPCLFLGNADGVYFYVHLTSGRVFFSHHDSMSEAALPLAKLIDGEDHGEFVRAIFTQHSLFSLGEFRAFEKGLADFAADELCEMELQQPKRFFALIKSASGWTYEHMGAVVYEWLEYLTCSDDNRHILLALIEEELAEKVAD